MLALEASHNTSSISSNRRSFVCSLAAVGAFGRFLFEAPISVEAERVSVVGGSPNGQRSPKIALSNDESIHPFHIHFHESSIVDLSQRIAATKWPERELVTDESQGVQLSTMRALANYWQTDYDWRKIEARLNALPQFMTSIDGFDIHFIHVRSKNANALPVVISHGWPGSIIEQLKIISPLTNPTAYGGKAEDSFDVVIPSLPGYGFSGKPTENGWDTQRIARAWIELMKRLGYTRYVAQGGDWGNYIVEQMALLTPPGLLGIHTNMPGTIPDKITTALKLGHPSPSGLSVDEKHAWDQLYFFYRHGTGYAQEMGNRPQTLYALGDSPVGLAAWMIDHDAASEALISRAFAGQPEGLTQDDVLDNITLYWLTKTAISAGRLYWESKHVFCARQGVAIPVAVSVFPDEIYSAPQSWAEQAYPQLIHYNRLSKGGHFAAWEQPKLFTEEICASFRMLR